MYEAYRAHLNECVRSLEPQIEQGRRDQRERARAEEEVERKWLKRSALRRSFSWMAEQVGGGGPSLGDILHEGLANVADSALTRAERLLEETRAELTALQSAATWTPDDIERRLARLRRDRDEFQGIASKISTTISSKESKEGDWMEVLGAVFDGATSQASGSLLDAIAELERYLQRPPAPATPADPFASAIKDISERVNRLIATPAATIVEIERVRQELHERYKAAPQAVHSAIGRMCDDEVERILERRRAP